MKAQHYNPHYFTCSRGFTLLELLIAVSLSAVLMTVLVVGLNSITRDWEKSGNKLDEKIDNSLLLLQLEKAILGTYPYLSQENSVAQEQLFFDGSKTELSWVSTVSPERNSSLNLWHLAADENNGFKLNVLTVSSGDLNKQLEKAQSAEQEPIHYFKDYKVSLHYLVETTNQHKEWKSSWSGKDEEQFPLGVKIQFKLDDESEQNLDFYVFSFIRVNTSENSTVKNNPFFGGGSDSPFTSQEPNAAPKSNPLLDLMK